MNLARSAHRAGQIDGEAYETLRSKFNAIHEWAKEHLGERALSEGVRTLDARDYRPPIAEPDAVACTGKGRATGAGWADAIALVDAIAENALALGWSRDRLYAAGKGLFDPKRRLICHLKPGDRIGEVSAQSIEIIHPLPSEVRHRFYNPDVDQPWIRRVMPAFPGC